MLSVAAIARVTRTPNDLSTFESMPLVIGNEPGGKRPWRGTLAEVATEHEVLVQELAVLAPLGVPPGVPGLRVAEPETDGMYLLTHCLLSFFDCARSELLSWNRSLAGDGPELHRDVSILVEVALHPELAQDLERAAHVA